jgi:predicted ATPase/DNA-binding XRE family transcriptional regulator
MRTSEDTGRQTALLAFGHHLKRLRVSADLTQEELAERAGVSARLISDLERGTIHRPRRDTVQLLADGLRLRGSERDTFVALARGQPVTPPDAPVSLPPYSLPRPPTPIVGRRQELATALALLLDPEVNLLTLIGTGGVGKTRLALEIGSRAVEAIPDGAAFVDLAPVRTPELVLAAIARALKVQADPEVPLRQTVVDFMQGKLLLLILDNFEHVLVAAPVVADLLAACRELTILATSRKPLHIRAEHQFPVGPLTLPDLDKVLRPAELVEVPAVELFVRRAQAANRDFSLSTENARTIAEITVRLDGLPLAIELAATRANVLSPVALLAHLERRLPLLTRGFQDLPERQQALRATLDWSHDLLTTAEQTLFRRLAVFTGGCTLDGAAAVSGASSPPDSPQPEFRSPNGPLLPDLLAGLVDTSLLRPLPGDGGELRYGMLETVREYGLEHLAAAGEEATVRRWHLTWCLDLAKRAEPELTGANQQHWFACLQTEHDNLRAALARAISENDAEAALGLSGALYRFWATQGYYEEGRRWLETALALSSGARSAPRGHALLGTGVMAFFQGRYDQAETCWRESLSLFRSLGDTTGVAYSHGNLGLVADAQGDYEGAIASYEEALALFRQLDDRTFIAYMLHNLGLIAYFQGHHDRAMALYEESLALVRALEDQNSIAMTLGNLGLVAFVQGDYEQALALQHEALTLGRKLTNKPWLARGIEHFALIAAATNASERAARLFGAAAALREQFNASLPPNDREFNARYIAEATAQLGPERFAAAWAEGQAMSSDEAIDYALGKNEEHVFRAHGAS